jgi:phosphatidyl-myo-inositol dimannoside synthase
MNILLFTLEYPPFKGGIANYYENLVKHWPKSDNVFVLHNNENKLITNWLLVKWLPAVWHLFFAIKKNKINHVIVGQILPLGTAAWLISKITKINYSVILHGMDIAYSQRQERKRKLTNKILKSAQVIICVNSYTAEITKGILEQNQHNKIVVVNPGVNPNIKVDEIVAGKIKDRHNLGNKIILFSIGRLVKRKGFDNVIKAMPEVIKSSPNVYYFIAGDGPDKVYLHEMAKGIANIIFLGALSDEEKWAWLSLCDIFIMPARDIDGDFDGFGIVYLEANIFGKPVIAGDSGGIKDAVQSAYSGIMVDPENIDRITGAIIALAQDAKLKIKLGEQGRARAIKDFNWEKQIEKIYTLLHN